MKTPPSINAPLSALAVAGVAAYVLACTAFSPDDSKVLLAAADARTGDLGISVFDRKTEQLEPVFVPTRFRSVAQSQRDAVMMRPLWTPDGRNVVVLWPGYSDNDDDVLNVAVVPFGGKGVTRLFVLPEVEDANTRLLQPLPIVGNRLFVGIQSNLVARLDLATGELKTHFGAGEELGFLPSPGDQLFYASSKRHNDEAVEVGRLDPETFAQSPIQQIGLGSKSDDVGAAVSPDGKRIVCIQKKGVENSVRIFQPGEPEKTVKLNFGEEKVALGAPQVSARQDLIYASYASEGQGEGKGSYGIMEIPLNGDAPRRIVLIKGVKDVDDKDAAFFQMSLSHDGKTAAACSTFLAVGGDRELQAADCALFMVDLSSPERTVKKTGLPLPPKGKNH